MKKLLACLLLCCLLLSACGNPSAADPFAYLDTPLTMTVRGSLRLMSPDKPPRIQGSFAGVIRTGEPLNFSASVRIEPLSKGQVADGTSPFDDRWQISITYSAPPALKGLTVSCTVSADSVTSEAQLTYPLSNEQIAVTLPYDSVCGLLRPALCLLPQGDVTNVSPVKDGTRSVTVTESATDTETVYSFCETSPCPAEINVTTPDKILHLYLDQAD